MPAIDAKFNTFANGGALEVNDIVVGLRNGVNTRFTFNGATGEYLPLSGGTMTGGIDMSNNAITGLPAPSATTDATNKEYVDSLTAAVGALGTFPQSNGTNWVASAYKLPTSVGASGTILSSNGTDYVVSTATFPTVATSTGSFLYADGTNWVASTSLWPNTVGATGKIIRSDGTTNAYTTATFADTYAASTLLYSNGADTVEGLATANSAMLFTNASGVPAWSASMEDGQIMIGSTGGSPAPATITAGSGVSIAVGANSITIAATGSGLAWNSIAGTTQTAVADAGYYCANAGATTITLPATANLGQVVLVEGTASGGSPWILTANVGQTIQIGTSTTSSGGTLTAAAATDNIEVVCIVANTTWRVQRTNSSGLTVA